MYSYKRTFWPIKAWKMCWIFLLTRFYDYMIYTAPHKTHFFICCWKVKLQCRSWKGYLNYSKCILRHFVESKFSISRNDYFVRIKANFTWSYQTLWTTTDWSICLRYGMTNGLSTRFIFLSRIIKWALHIHRIILSIKLFPNILGLMHRK